MSLGLFIAFITVFAPLIVWALRNEERLIDLEDKIIADIKDSRAQAKREKSIHVVERKNISYDNEFKFVRDERNFVA